MSSPLVFVTGATGFIGAATAIEALEAGYKLRLAVRKPEQVDILKKAFSQHADKLEFVIVPDITAPGAYANVLDGVTHVLHIASPLAGSNVAEEVISPAVEGTLSILRDAAKVPTIKKVVITSSVAALTPVSGIPTGGVIKEETDFDLSVDRNQSFDAGHPQLTAFRIYGASKLLANQASWDFVKNEKPGFELVTIHPTFVYGHNPLHETQGLAGSNGLLMSNLVNGKQGDGALLGVGVKNVAEAHVRALDDKIKSTSYLVSGKRFTWKDVVDVVEKYYPDFKIKVESTTDVEVPLTDTSRAEKDLGIKWTEPADLIREVLDQQLAQK